MCAFSVAESVLCDVLCPEILLALTTVGISERLLRRDVFSSMGDRKIVDVICDLLTIWVVLECHSSQRFP